MKKMRKNSESMSESWSRSKYMSSSWFEWRNISWHRRSWSQSWSDVPRRTGSSGSGFWGWSQSFAWSTKRLYSGNVWILVYDSR
jgi:hypothetical protein